MLTTLSAVICLCFRRSLSRDFSQRSPLYWWESAALITYDIERDFRDRTWPNKFESFTALYKLYVLLNYLFRKKIKVKLMYEKNVQIITKKPFISIKNWWYYNCLDFLQIRADNINEFTDFFGVENLPQVFMLFLVWGKLF